MREREKIRDYCRSSGIFALAGTKRAVIVALSGGADSVFLLNVIGDVFPGLSIGAAHLDHMLRGEEAKRDRDFCRGLCRRLGVRFFEGEADIFAIAEKERKSTEEAGRDERYAFFRKCRKQFAEELDISEDEVLIATAHNADDNLETVLFNLTRGAGLRGLCGIPPIRDGYIIRPVLCLTSDEIREYCRAEEVSFVVDSTNLEDGYTRNRIRHKVIPELKKINPAVSERVSAASLALGADEAYLEEIAGAAEETSAKELSSLPAPLASRAIAGAYRRASGRAADRSTVDAVLGALRSGGHGRLHLPYGVTAYYGKTLEFAVEDDKNEKVSFRFDAAEGECEMTEYGFSIGFYPEGNEPDNEIYKELIYKIVINDKIKNNLFVRSREPGDRIVIGGHRRKLKKLLCDAGVPLRKRDRLPVVCDGEGIVWVPGFPARDGAAAKDGRGITITYREFGKEDCNG